MRLKSDLYYEAKIYISKRNPESISILKIPIQRQNFSHGRPNPLRIDRTNIHPLLHGKHKKI